MRALLFVSVVYFICLSFVLLKTSPRQPIFLQGFQTVNCSVWQILKLALSMMAKMISPTPEPEYLSKYSTQSAYTAELYHVSHCPAHLVTFVLLCKWFKLVPVRFVTFVTKN